jgi:transposase-like protein
VATVLCQSEIRSSQKRSKSNLKKKGKLVIQCDEMWSFVGFKGNKQWIWLAIDVLTKEIVGVYIGKRDETGARGCGIQYLQFIVNVLSAIQTFGVLTK